MTACMTYPIVRINPLYSFTGVILFKLYYYLQYSDILLFMDAYLCKNVPYPLHCIVKIGNIKIFPSIIMYR